MAGMTYSTQLLARAIGALMFPAGVRGRFRGDGPFSCPTGH
jgi:hypothetical protein